MAPRVIYCYAVAVSGSHRSCELGLRVMMPFRRAVALERVCGRTHGVQHLDLGTSMLATARSCGAKGRWTLPAALA